MHIISAWSTTSDGFCSVTVAQNRDRRPHPSGCLNGCLFAFSCNDGSSPRRCPLERSDCRGVDMGIIDVAILPDLHDTCRHTDGLMHLFLCATQTGQAMVYVGAACFSIWSATTQRMEGSCPTTRGRHTLYLSATCSTWRTIREYNSVTVIFYCFESALFRSTIV